MRKIREIRRAGKDAWMALRFMKSLCRKCKQKVAEHLNKTGNVELTVKEMEKGGVLCPSCLTRITKLCESYQEKLGMIKEAGQDGVIDSRIPRKPTTNL